jgi:hypothetical protein
LLAASFEPCLRSIDSLSGWIVWPCIAIKTLLSIGPDVTQDNTCAINWQKDLQEIQVGYLKELPPDFSEVEVVCSGCPAILCSNVTAGGSGQ